jgi:hypothetical protein
MAVDRIGDGLALRSKGDIVSHDGTGVISQGVGTNGQILVARSSATTGLSWETPPAQSAQYYQHIGSATATAEVSSITISSITSGFTDLKVYISCHGRTQDAVAANYVYIRLNGSSSTIYDSSYLWIQGATMTAWEQGSNINNSAFFVGNHPNRGTTANMVYCADLDIFQYSSTSTNKTAYCISSSISTSTADTSRFLMMSSMNFRSTSAVTSIEFYTSSATPKFGIGTKMTVFGIKRYGL